MQQIMFLQSQELVAYNRCTIIYSVLRIIEIISKNNFICNCPELNFEGTWEGTFCKNAFKNPQNFSMV